MFSSQTCCWCCCWLSCSKFFGDGLEVSVCTSFQQPRQLFLVLTGTQESANFQRFKHKLCRFSGTSLLSTSSHSRNPLCLQQRSWPPLTLLQTQPACIAWYPSLSALRRATDGASLCNSLTYALQGTEELAWGALIHHCYEAQIQAPAALLLQGWEMKDTLAAIQYFSLRLIPKMGAEREIRPSPQSHSPTSPQGERVEEQKAAPYTVWYTRVLTFINCGGGGDTNCIWQWIFKKN